MLASLRSDGWTASPELVDDFTGIRSIRPNTSVLTLMETTLRSRSVQGISTGWPRESNRASKGYRMR
jgi:hypothetical protein